MIHVLMAYLVQKQQQIIRGVFHQLRKLHNASSRE